MRKLELIGNTKPLSWPVINRSQSRFDLSKLEEKMFSKNQYLIDVRPNLFLVGAMKSGTTTAHAFLTLNKEVQSSPYTKEPNHFCTDLHHHRHRWMEYTIHNFSGLYHINNDSEYRRIYQSRAGSDYVIDSSPSYLYSKDAAANIASFNKDANIIILLRDPVYRAWSEYKMNRAIGLEFNKFPSALAKEHRTLAAGKTLLLKRYIQAGLYTDQVERYIRRFDRKRIFIDIVDRPDENFSDVMLRLLEFLNLPERSNVVGWENEARAPRSRLLNSIAYYSGAKAAISQIIPSEIKKRGKLLYYGRDEEPLSPKDRVVAATYFSDDNRRLAALTGLDLSHWTRA